MNYKKGADYMENNYPLNAGSTGAYGEPPIICTNIRDLRHTWTSVTSRISRLILLMSQLLIFYGLPDWKGVIERMSVDEAGFCCEDRQCIGLSEQLVLSGIVPFEFILDTLKHELAHALTTWSRPRFGMDCNRKTNWE